MYYTTEFFVPFLVRFYKFLGFYILYLCSSSPLNSLEFHELLVVSQGQAHYSHCRDLAGWDSHYLDFAAALAAALAAVVAFVVVAVVAFVVVAALAFVVVVAL